MALDKYPARRDLTDRECAKILGGPIGQLMDMTQGNEVRDAVRWWAGLTDEQWAELRKAGQTAAARALSSFVGTSLDPRSK